MAAIYQWVTGSEVIYTTTIYPIDVSDTLQLNMVTNPYGNLTIFPSDTVEAGATVTEIELVQLLLTTDVGADYAIAEAGVTEIELVQLLLTTDAGADEAIAEAAVTEIELIEMLITCDTPDESLQLSCSVNASNSHLTPV